MVIVMVCRAAVGVGVHRVRVRVVGCRRYGWADWPGGDRGIEEPLTGRARCLAAVLSPSVVHGCCSQTPPPV